MNSARPGALPEKTPFMKIALIRKRYTDFGGAERYISELASSLVSRGHDVHVYAEEWRAVAGLKFHRFRPALDRAFSRFSPLPTLSGTC